MGFVGKREGATRRQSSALDCHQTQSSSQTLSNKSADLTSSQSHTFGSKATPTKVGALIKYTHQQLDPREMGHQRNSDLKLSGKIFVHRSQNLLASRSVPILFIIVCFLIIANSRCDQVGSTNDAERELEADATTTEKYDPKNMLREIYLDQNSKIITMFSPPLGDSVQKFHPNGRYGRRSVDGFAEPSSAHAELGQLTKLDGRGHPLRTLLHGYGHYMDQPAAPGNVNGLMNSLPRVFTSSRLSSSQQQVLGEPTFADPDAASHDIELGKLLRCNYTGRSNLYWCDSGSIES